MIIIKGYKIEPYLYNENNEVGDKISLEKFLDYFENSVITDDDGIAKMIIINGYVVAETEFYPSEMFELKSEFLNLQQEKGKIETVWYNK